MSTPHDVQAAAVRLFLEKGYSATTMDDVAQAAGVGRTTLFRYFSGKPALVWWDLDDNYARLDGFLTTMAEEGTTREVSPPQVLDQVRAAVHEALVGMPTGSDLMRQRWQLIDHDPAVAAELSVLMMRWATRIARHVQELGGERLRNGAADAVGYAVLGVTVSATRTWSATADPTRTLSEEMDEIMGPLTDALQVWLASGA